MITRAIVDRYKRVTNEKRPCDTSGMMKARPTPIKQRNEEQYRYTMETGKCKHSYGNLAHGQCSLRSTWTVLPVQPAASACCLLQTSRPNAPSFLIDRDSISERRPLNKARHSTTR